MTLKQNGFIIKSNDIYIRYAPDLMIQLNTRTFGRWYKRIGISQCINKETTYLCTTTRHTTNHVLYLSTSYDKPDPNDLMHKMIYPQPNWNSFRALLTYDYDGNERTMVDSLTREEAIIVSDGSYDITSGEGSAAIIFETCTTKKRLTNACLVPANTFSIYSQANGPYRCELMAVLLALIMIYDLEQKCDSAFIGMTVAVDNDRALEVSMVYDDLTECTQQHFDLISSIQEVKKVIRTPLTYKYVTGHLDSKRNYATLTREEQLNVEADYLAKGVRQYGRDYPEFTPNLYLPFEPISIYHNNTKIYNNFHTRLPIITYHHNAQKYYCSKYAWSHHDFDSIN